MKTVVRGHKSEVEKMRRLEDEKNLSTSQPLNLLSSRLLFHVSCLSYVLLLLFMTSCASQKAAKQGESRYLSVLEKWTRDGKIYEDFETTVLINATYKTKEFRESYAAEYINTFMLDTDKADKLIKGEVEASKKYHEFFLSIHTPNVEWSDLEKKEPIWVLYLITDAGESVSPLDIKKVKDKGPGVVRFYPYFTEWSVGYTVRFPLNLPDGREFITAEAKYIKLVLTGTPGKGELVWNLKP